MDLPMGIAMGPREFKQRLRALSPEEFEHFVADVWERFLSGSTTVTQASNDMGVDVLRHGHSEREAVQVKRYGANNSLGRPDVQQYHALYEQENADRVTVVTSGPIADTAERWAAEHDVTLFDGDDLYDLIRDGNATELLSTWFYEDDVTLRRRQSLPRRAIGLLLSSVASGIRLGRPLWNLGVALVSTFLILAGLAALTLSSFVSQPGSGAQASLDQVELLFEWISIVSFPAVPISLLLYGKRRQSALFLGALVVPLIVTNAFTLPEVAVDIGTILLFVVFLALSAYDLYDVYKLGWRTHVTASIAPTRRLIGPGGAPASDENTDINPFGYASVAARK